MMSETARAVSILINSGGTEMVKDTEEFILVKQYLVYFYMSITSSDIAETFE